MPRTTTLKCFQGNLDGKRDGLVIASSQKKAADIANMSIHELRKYWSASGAWPSQEMKINCLYTKPSCGSKPWVEGLCKLTWE